MSTSTRRRFLTASAAALFALGANAPVAAQTYCGIANRECVIFIAELTSSKQTYQQQQFYKFLEWGHEAVITGILASRYNRLHVVKGSAATRSGLVNKLNYVAGRSSVRAVDLIFVGHGLAEKVVFSDGKYTMASVRDQIRSHVTWWKRRKFRMLYSTACYGSSHRYYWRNAGFKSVSGSRRICADSGLALPVFLTAWSGVQTYGMAINAANGSDPARVQDNIAKQLLLSWGYDKWWDVNSYRDRSGNSYMRITHRPY